MAQRIRLENVRIAFPQLFEAKQVNGEGQAAFSAMFILPPDHPQMDAINNAIEAEAKEKWPAKWKAILPGLRGRDKVCLHNGDLKAQYEGLEGNWYVSARNKVKPLVVDRDKQRLEPQDGKPYAGCYVHASIEIWAQDNSWGQRINATLRGVQFYKDGDAFAGGSPADESEFEDIADTGGDGGLV